MNDHILSVLATLAASHGDSRQPEAVFKALDHALQKTVSHTLFTILMYDRAMTESIRVYANLKDDYPLGGRKKIISPHWANQVIRDGLPFIGNNAQDLRQVFSDHELIQSLGCESVLNIPVRWQGRTIGTLNLLHTANWYKDVCLDLMTCTAQLAAPALMMLEAHVG
jgi:transcriptional regulator with GAF, ATPase, and Fis domain